MSAVAHAAAFGVVARAASSPRAGTAPRSAASLGIRRPARAVAVSRAPSSLAVRAAAGSADDLLVNDDEGLWSRIASDVDCIVMDCDGVVWQGDTLLPGVRESIALLRESGKRLVFVTNNSNKSRREYVHKFEKLGISVEKEEVFSAAFAAAAYLKTQGMKKKAYVVGGRGVVDELNEMQIEVDPGVFNAVKCTEADWEELIVDEDVGAVIVGQDVAFTYAKLAYASLAIQRGATFVATNPDAGDAIGPGFMPGAGAIVAAVEKASGVAPEMYAGEAERVPSGAAQGELRRHGEDPRRGRQAGHRRRVRQGGGSRRHRAHPLGGVHPRGRGRRHRKRRRERSGLRVPGVAADARPGT